MTRVLVTGGKGMLGRALVERRPPKVEILAVDVDELDVTSAAAVRACFADFSPQAVIHCAALTDVDGCETDPEAARLVNVEGTQNIATACGHTIRLIHISTDFVFDGQKNAPYAEDDPPRPINAYGASKLAAEERVLTLAANYAIVRTAWTFAPWGRNFVLAILEAARKTRHLRVVADQTGSPTYALDLAGALWQLLAQERRGTFHLVNSGVVSRYEFAREIVEAASLGDVTIQPIRSADLSQPALRPSYSALANTKLPPLRHYRQALVDCLARISAEA